MTDQEKIVTWGILAFIAWELWQGAPSQQLKQPIGIDTVGDNIPIWVKQLSRVDNNVDYFRRVC